ncbi:MAG: Fe-S protein assembly co-chaperone HscB [Polyangiaceae bacterium]|nr:Fe-S protein assembly co-chaperone HscB [Polyangiaceae bacterium]
MTDPFDTLGVEPRFDLDLRAVEQRHRDLSKALHPDRYAGAPAAERRLALGRAIEVNEAFRVLRDPIRRAEALFARAGVEIGEAAAPRPSPAFLMDMMESREELSLAAGKRDAARVAALGAAMRGREQRALSALAAGLDGAAGDAQRIRAVLPLLGELRYYRRFLDEASAIEEDLSEST